MPNYPNITQIPAPRVELIDPRTGLMSREWFRFFNNIYTVVGANLGIIQIPNGGTGLSALPSNGQILIGNNNLYSLNTLTPGVGIGIVNGAGSISISNKGVLSFSGGTTGLTPAGTTTGAIALAGTLIAANGGTGHTSYTIGDLLYANTTTTLAKLAGGVANNDKVLTIVAGVPAWSTAGNVVGPASSTDNAVARFDSTTGKLLQNSVVTIGDTGATTGVTTFAASTSVTTPIVQATNSAGLALKNSAGTTQMSVGAGGGDNMSINVSTNLNGTNAQIDISPTGTGHVHIKPTGVNSVEIIPVSVGKMDNVAIGATTASTGAFTTISGSDQLTLTNASNYNLYASGAGNNYMAGSLGIGATPSASVNLDVSKVIGSGATTAYGIWSRGLAAPTATSTVIGVVTQVGTSSNGGTPYTISALAQFRAIQGTINADSTVTNQYGFEVNSGLTGATNNYGFYGNIASATGRYNLYMNGTAPNYFAGDMQVNNTITAAGTTGAQTINKTAGTVNFAATATSLVVTNSLVATTSIIIATVGTNDTTMKSVSAVAAGGSFTLYANAAATAETRVNFMVFN
jgi:hypothetical protein